MRIVIILREQSLYDFQHIPAPFQQLIYQTVHLLQDITAMTFGTSAVLYFLRYLASKKCH